MGIVGRDMGSYLKVCRSGLLVGWRLEVGYWGGGGVGTYSFLSCGDWECRKGEDKVESTPLPARLLIYVDTNSVGNSVGWYVGILRRELLNRRSVGAGSSKGDLVELLRGRHRLVDRVSFNRDYGLGVVRVHFAKRLRGSNVDLGEEWGKFLGYMDSDDIYGG